MSTIPEDLRYTRDHEWIRLETGTQAVCGITDHAQHMLNDIVFVELPEPGMRVAQRQQLAVIESVKAVSDVYSPVAGEIIAVNDTLESAPEKMNSAPYAEGWLFRIEVDDPAQLDTLLSPAAYARLVEAEEEA